ncbi:HMG-box [Trametes coccinea BRFM310]|uniref:HMG-box n=1 Tax=Trametes coccinea (strain BRFM310) TaxID=1353009 RepID=A0A1Y2IKS6_TRAC3|nr:HMG-box [Trametes coccinea BRFM310]
MATDTNAIEFAKLQLVGSLQGLAQHLRECAMVAEAYGHTLMGQPFPHLPVNGQFPMGMGPPVMPVAQENGKKRKRGEDAEGKKRAKKPKDPNAPKRPASSYLLFQNDVRNELKAKHPDMRNNELLSTIAKLWADMPQEQKDEYERRNKLAKDKWLAQKAIYEGKAEAPAVAVSV